VGRLEDIVDRNKHPGKHRKMRFPVGIMLSAFVLLVLVLMIFTDLGVSPTTKPAEPPPSGEKRVDGVLLYSPRARVDAGTGSAATGSAAAGATAQPR
jgi:hypothetical protein